MEPNNNDKCNFDGLWSNEPLKVLVSLTESIYMKSYVPNPSRKGMALATIIKGDLQRVFDEGEILKSVLPKRETLLKIIGVTWDVEPNNFNKKTKETTIIIFKCIG
jgi:hypothetical protein